MIGLACKLLAGSKDFSLEVHNTTFGAHSVDVELQTAALDWLKLYLDTGGYLSCAVQPGGPQSFSVPSLDTIFSPSNLTVKGFLRIRARPGRIARWPLPAASPGQPLKLAPHDERGYHLRYRVLGPLGRGGMGEVYRAEDKRLKRPVALKFLPPDSLSGQDKRRLLNEARAAAVIRHPNICPIYDIEEADGQVFIAMAYLEGETLLRRIERGPLPIRQAVDIATQIARGLEAAHAQGIVHRDIKSGNIIVGHDGHVSILDFGLAVRSGHTRLTRAGSTVGTPAYMSPEQVRGLEVDARKDIWSLGVLLYEMLTGLCPFRRDHVAAVSHAILTDAPPSLASLRPETPAKLRSVVQTALAKRPEERW